MEEQINEYGWLALEIAKAFQIYKTSYQVKELEPPLDAAGFADEFVSDYIVTLYRLPVGERTFIEESYEPDETPHFSLKRSDVSKLD